MQEASKAAKRRLKDWRFVNRWFVGKLLDVGCGDDPIKKEDWPNITEVVLYDKILGGKDEQYLPEIKDAEFDVVHSSHSLEHMQNPRNSLVNWLRVLKPGGFIVCTIPDELLYEQGRFPSPFNPDHKSSFTLRSMPIIPTSQHIAHLLWKLPVDMELLQLLTEHWDPKKYGQDQTMLGLAECALEFVARKPKPPDSSPL